MIINYYQPRDAGREGVVVLDGEIFRTTGRLDAVGSRVFAWGRAHRDPERGVLRLAVQCERTSDAELAAEITVLGRGGVVLFTHRIPKIPLAVTP